MLTNGKRTGASTGGVLHWAGRVTDEVFSFLGPTSAALADAGVEQTIVLSDEPRYRHLLPRFHRDVRLVLTAAEANSYRRWRQAKSAFVNVLRDTSPTTVHLHGFVPYALSLRELQRLPSGLMVCYSPHGSRTLRPWAMPTLLLRAALQALPASAQLREIASIRTDRQRLETISPRSVELVESQVSEVFFSVARREALHPLVVTGNRVATPESADIFSRLAVLLSDQELRISFNWIGAADGASQALLHAANVGVFDETDDARRANRLASAWVFIATRGTDGFPLALAEAMAAGLPCAAVDTPYHRDLIEHGITGYLCRTDEELLERTATLMDSPTLRARLGLAARSHAERRFSGSSFRDSVFDAYLIEPVRGSAGATALRGTAPYSKSSTDDGEFFRASSAP